MVEQGFCKAKVGGSNPLLGSVYPERSRRAGVAERPIAPDCKSGARTGYVGSNPTSSTYFVRAVVRVRGTPIKEDIVRGESYLQHLLRSCSRSGSRSFSNFLCCKGMTPLRGSKYAFPGCSKWLGSARHPRVSSNSPYQSIILVGKDSSETPCAGPITLYHPAPI